LRWDLARLESVHELGEDCYEDLEDEFIDEAEANPGDRVALRLATRETVYFTGGHGSSR
jgi:hypothetical protein